MDDDDGLSRATVFAVLTDGRRRTILSCLRADGRRVSLDDLGREVVARELGIDPQAVADGQLTAVRTALVEDHLPLLEDAGLVEFRPGEGVAADPERLASVAPYLDATDGRSRGRQLRPSADGRSPAGDRQGRSPSNPPADSSC